MSFYGTRYAMPRKTCQLRLSQNSTKFDVLARFRETIPTVKSVSSSEIQRINFRFLTEIKILPFLRKLNFLGSYSVCSNMLTCDELLCVMAITWLACVCVIA